MIDCTKVYPVEREILILSNPGDLIKLLVNGPSEAELAEGYYTTIPKDVVLNNIGLDNGIIRVDFSNLDSGGSCRVDAIRSQITETLKQIYGVKEVVISVDGNVEEALQP
jgi:spore germination protein GerM